MPAVYTTGTNPVSATPAADLIAIIDAAILAHPNWSKVETNLATTTTAGVANVYKCSGAGNSFGADFFFVLWKQNASATAIYFQCFETWDAVTTHTGTRPCNSGTAFSTAPTGPYATNGGLVVNNNSFAIDSAATGKPDNCNVNLNAGLATPYAIHVSKSRVEFYLSFGGGQNVVAVLAGVYVPNPRGIAGVANVFPLFLWGQINLSLNNAVVGYVGSNYARFSRMPGNGGSALGALVPSSQNMCGIIDTAGSVPDPIENVIRGTGVLLTGSAPVGFTANSGNWQSGYVRGSLPGAYVFLAKNNGVGPLDLVQLSDGTQLMPLGPANAAGVQGTQAFVAITSDA